MFCFLDHGGVGFVSLHRRFHILFLLLCSTISALRGMKRVSAKPPDCQSQVIDCLLIYQFVN